MAMRKIDQLLQSADALSSDEMLEVAQKLIERARLTKSPSNGVDLNSLAGTLKLTEDPLAIQERMRREWE